MNMRKRDWKREEEKQNAYMKHDHDIIVLRATIYIHMNKH
jgi:hypothetical protein